MKIERQNLSAFLQPFVTKQEDTNLSTNKQELRKCVLKWSACNRCHDWTRDNLMSKETQMNVTNIGESTMKISDLCETTAGAIAAVATPVGGMVSRQMKNADGTAKNALDIDANILGHKKKKTKKKR